MNLIRSQFDGQDKKVNTPADEAVDIVTSRESEVTHEQHPWSYLDQDTKCDAQIDNANK